jgi:hypothetical protein
LGEIGWEGEIRKRAQRSRVSKQVVKKAERVKSLSREIEKGLGQAVRLVEGIGNDEVDGVDLRAGSVFGRIDYSVEEKSVDTVWEHGSFVVYG